MIVPSLQQAATHPLVGRTVQALVTAWAALSLGFLLIHQLPQGPMQILVNLYGLEQVQDMSATQIEQELNRLVGYSSTDPLYVQYLDYWVNIVTLDFGESILYGDPVFEVLAPAIPWTVMIGVLALTFNTVLGLSMGAYMAYREGSRFDVGATFVSVVLGSIPYYVFAIFLLFFLGFQAGWFPTGGRYDTSLAVGFNLDFILSALHHVALPFISLTFTSFAALGIRAHSIRVLGSDYIRVARLRGLRESRIVFHYVLRNSILPWYTGFVTGLVGILGGTVLLEFIFQYPGMGWYLFRTAAAQDIPMILGTFAFFTIAAVVMLFVVDLTYVYIDPRAEGVGMDESF